MISLKMAPVALVDLRALAHLWTVAAEPRTPGTPTPAAMSSGREGPKTTAIRQSTACGKLETHGPPDVGSPSDERAKPTNVLLPPPPTVGRLAEAAAPASVRSPTTSLADAVEAMADEMAANPVHRITNRETAMEYFRGVAMNRLIAINDTLALLPPSLPAEAQPLHGTIARLTIPTDQQART
jgi:hypothetical protein